MLLNELPRQMKWIITSVMVAAAVRPFLRPVPAAGPGRRGRPARPSSSRGGIVAAIPPVLVLAGAAIQLWSVTVGLHIGQALGVCGLIAAGLGTGRRLHASRWGVASYVIWLTVSGLLVVGIEALSRTV